MITETQTQSLIEKYKNAPAKEMPYGVIYPERQELQRELQKLLSYEANNTLYYLGTEKAQELLAEYRSTFDWNEKYSVQVDWGMTIMRHTAEYECKSKEEALAYESGDLECEAPDLCDIIPEYELSGDCSSPLIRVWVSDLEPKRAKQLITLTVLVDNEVSIEEVESTIMGFYPNTVVVSTIQEGETSN